MAKADEPTTIKPTTSTPRKKRSSKPSLDHRPSSLTSWLPSSTRAHLPTPTTRSTSISYAKKLPIFGIRDKALAIKTKLNYLSRLASDPHRSSIFPPATRPDLLDPRTFPKFGPISTLLNQEIANRLPLKAFRDQIKQVNHADNTTRSLHAQQRNQKFRYSPSSDFHTSLSRTTCATLETPRPPEPALPAYEEICARQKQLDLTFGKRPVARRFRIWRKSLEPDKLALVQKILQQPGKISDLPGAYCEAHDIRKLKPCQWINDEIVTFYGVMINLRSIEFEKDPNKFLDSNPSERFLKSYCFSSFFMSKYDQDGYDGVKRWSKKVDLLSKDVIIFPINIRNAHWTCASINLRAKRFEYFDSMGNRNQSVLANLRDYIVNEALNKKNLTLDVTTWPDFYYPNVPQQDNSFDCGIFVCQFMESLSRDWSCGAYGGPKKKKSIELDEQENMFDFDQSNMKYIRTKMVYEIATKQFLNEEWNS